MGQIQNAINQVFTSALGAGLAYQHSPYAKNQEKIRKAGAIKEQISQTQAKQTPAEGQIVPNVGPGTDALPLGADVVTQYKKNPEKLESLVKLYEEGKLPEKEQKVEERVSADAKTYEKEFSPYFAEEKRLTEEYNTIMAGLGRDKDKFSIADISKREQELAKKIADSLRQSYTSVEGIKNTNALRERLRKEAKGGLNNGK